MAWLSGGWTHRIEITIDHTRVDASLTWFPVMLHLSASCGIGSADLSRIFNDLGANNLKMAVTSSDGTTQLYVEIEEWDSTNKEAVLWVSKTGWTISNTVDTVLYLYYDAAIANNTTYIGVIGSTPGKAVWNTNFVAVYHMVDKTGDNTKVLDSSATAATAAKGGTAGNPTEVEGLIGKAQQFPAGFSYLLAPTVGIAAGPFTLEAVNKVTGTQVDYATWLGISSTHRMMTNYLGRRLYRNTTNWNGDTAFGINVWTHDAFVDDGANQYGYVDGVLDGTGAFTNHWSAPVYIGSYGNADNYNLEGYVCEVRISDVIRTAPWLLATYYTCWDNFVTYTPIGVFPKAKVRIAFASNPFDATPTWTNVTDDLRSYSIRRGRNHELDRMEAGTAVIELNNDSGNYYPDNTGGSYYDNVKTMKRVNIQLSYDGGDNYYDRYTGYIESLTPSWLGAGGFAPIVTIECADAVKCLSRLLLNNAGEAAEASGTRVGNVLDELSWPAGDRDLDTGQYTMVATGAQSNVNALDHLQQVQEAELGLLYVAPDGDIQFEDRNHRVNSPHDTSQAIFGEDAGEMPYEDITFILDETLLYNEVRGNRSGGTEQTASNSTSQTTYGKRSLSRGSLLLTNDTHVKNYCTLLVARYSNVETRVRNILIRPASDPENLLPKVVSYDISTRITVRLDAAGINQDYFIEGIEEDLDETTREFTIRWWLSQASQYLATPDAVEDTLRPESNASVQWTPSAGSNYECVDEVTPDGDTTYVQGTKAAGGWLVDQYHIPSPADQTGTINSITVYANGKQLGATGVYQCTLYIGIKTNGTITYDAGHSTTTSYATYSKVWTTNPDTGVAFTWAQMIALQLCIKADDPGVAWDERVRVTQVYVVINYTPGW